MVDGFAIDMSHKDFFDYWLGQRFIRMNIYWNNNGRVDHRLRVVGNNGRVDHRLRVVGNNGSVDHRLRVVGNNGSVDHRLSVVRNNGRVEHRLSVVRNNGRVDHRLSVVRNNGRVDYRLSVFRNNGRVDRRLRLVERRFIRWLAEFEKLDDTVSDDADLAIPVDKQTRRSTGIRRELLESVDPN